jgi:hypothetical protein
MLGADRIVLFANAPADRLLGYAAGGLQGLHIDVVLRAGERDGEQSAVRADGSLMSVGVETRPLRLGERELMLLALTDSRVAGARRAKRTGCAMSCAPLARGDARRHVRCTRARTQPTPVGDPDQRAGGQRLLGAR